MFSLTSKTQIFIKGLLLLFFHIVVSNIIGSCGCDRDIDTGIEIKEADSKSNFYVLFNNALDRSLVLINDSKLSDNLKGDISNQIKSLPKNDDTAIINFYHIITRLYYNLNGLDLLDNKSLERSLENYLDNNSINPSNIFDSILFQIYTDLRNLSFKDRSDTARLLRQIFYELKKIILLNKNLIGLKTDSY
jgi:hypothetical protein